MALSGCASGSAVETRRPTQTPRIVSVEASQETSTVPVAADIVTRFQLVLDEALYDENHFQRGNQLKIKWRMAAFDEGNRALRYLVGFGAGKGKIVVTAKFYDQQGHEVGAIKSQGSIIGGAFGGSYQSAMSVCADAIGKYARDNFLARKR